VTAETVDAVLDLDGQWAERQEVREALRHRRRRASEETARARAEGRDTSDLEAAGRQVAGELAAVEAEVADLQTRRLAALAALPNLPATDTPDKAVEPAAPFEPPAPSEPAAGAAGYPPTAPPWPKPFAPLPHRDLVAMLHLAATAGSAGHGFLVWRGGGARLVRALTAFMLDVHTREFGYEEVRAPAVATREALAGSAHLPLLEDKMYAVAERARKPAAQGEPAVPAREPAAPGGMTTACPPSGGSPLRGHARPPSESMPTEKTPWACHPRCEPDLFLAPRAEPHLAGLYAGRILDAARLPVRLACAGPAFRREAGGGRGLTRLHQFDTLELYVFATAEQEEEELARAVRAAETILARLGVPHRRTLRPAPALSHAAAKTIDLEVWAPGTERAEGRGPGAEGKTETARGGAAPPSALDPRPSALRGRWLPVAALSTFTDYQARRTHTRYRDAAGRTRFVYTIGGAAVALPHLVAALLENGQEADGTVRLAPALAPYFGGEILRV
jgi:seryl-tRNA synthetase